MYQPDYVNNIVRFKIFEKTGLSERCYDYKFENEDELLIGVTFLRKTVGPQRNIKIQLRCFRWTL